MQNVCADPCGLREACGKNSLCKTVLHRPRCSCPSCYIGRANVECIPDPQCDTTSPRPNDVMTLCNSDADCHESLACNRLGQCADPCESSSFACEANKKCETRRHRPVCVCKSGFVVNEYGELICAPDKRQCARDDQCASNMACIDLRCQNPCAVTNSRGAPCPAEKSCQVQDHKPVCICMKDCSPSISICLRDSGCPAGLACRNYQCVNPCDLASCAANSPCFVEDHKPICKFCPPGFVADSKTGCQKGKKHFTQQQKTNTHKHTIQPNIFFQPTTKKTTKRTNSTFNLSRSTLLIIGYHTRLFDDYIFQLLFLDVLFIFLTQS